MSEKPLTTNYAGAIYGTILSMTVISTASSDPDLSSIEIAYWVAGTAIVFWLAHVYSRIVVAGVARPRQAMTLTRSTMREEWPLVQGALIPAAAMLLAPLGLVSSENSTYVAVWVGVAVLFLAGLVIGAREGMSWGRRLTVGSINAAIGLLIVALKIYVH